MPGQKIKAIILCLIAITIASGSVGAVYACYEPPPYGSGPRGRINVVISDQDESWTDSGVRATWTAENMVPGNEYAFTGCFVGLQNQSPKNVSRVISISCKYNPWSPVQPDWMAKFMEIVRCAYFYSDKTGEWQIDCLTGMASGTSHTGNSMIPADTDWRLRDVNRDGRKTFYDLNKSPLYNLPGDEARFEMSVRFNKDAGNEFQGKIFNLAMVYTLTPWQR